MSNGFGFRVWGARGSLPRLSRGQVRHGGNTMCIEVLHPGEEWIVLDAGTGIANLGDHILSGPGVPPIHLFLSHYHWDHIMGLPFFGPIYRKGYSISLYGLKADKGQVQEMLNVVFSPFYSPIYSPDNLLGSLSIPAPVARREIDGLRVDTYELEDIHPGGCMIMRIEADGKSLVYASDVELREPEIITRLIACCRDADVLLCDAAFSEQRFEGAVGWGHSSLEKAFETARRAGVKRLVGIHFDPLRTDDEMEIVREQLEGKCTGTAVELAREGETIWL